MKGKMEGRGKVIEKEKMDGRGTVIRRKEKWKVVVRRKTGNTPLYFVKAVTVYSIVHEDHIANNQ